MLSRKAGEKMKKVKKKQTAKTTTKKKSVKKCKRGFTLIELLVVVAIIGILAGIVVISLTSARERSRKASLQTTMASLMPVMSMCQNDGETVQAVVAGGSVCSGTEITETYPNPLLPANLGAGWSYDLNAGGTALVGTGPGGVTVTCTIASGSCL